MKVKYPGALKGPLFWISTPPSKRIRAGLNLDY